MTGTPATGVIPSPRSTCPDAVPCWTVTSVIATFSRTRSRLVVAPANGMFSLMNVLAFAVGLTASISRLPTGMRAMTKTPLLSVVAPYCDWSVRLVIRTVVSFSGLPDSSSVRPWNVPRPSSTTSTFRRCPLREILNWTSRDASDSGSTAVIRSRSRLVT